MSRSRPKSLALLFTGPEEVGVAENGSRAVSWATLDCVSFVLDRAERRFARSSLTLPMNLLVTARRPTQSVVSRSEGTV